MKYAKEIPGANKDPRFWASGISLVIHPLSPHVPPIHMNTRYIVTTEDWFGGTLDLNPIYPNEQDTKDFHAALKKCVIITTLSIIQLLKHKRMNIIILNIARNLGE